MSISEQDLIQKLETEYKQLVIEADACRDTIKAFQIQRKLCAREIRHLIRLADPAQQKTLADLEQQHRALTTAVEQQTKTLKEMDDKVVLLMMHCSFQKDILKLWDKEDYYRTYLDETGLSTREALLQAQGYTLPVDYFVVETSLSDYIRIGQKDIVDLLNLLKDPTKHITVFETAKREYAKHPDYNWGYVLSLCLDHGWGTEIDEKAAFAIDQQFAAQNHPLALCKTANTYFDGGIVKADKKLAIECYQRAIAPENQTFYLAHALWGNRLMQGDGVEQDEDQALHFLNIADEKGCSLASSLLSAYFFEKVSALQDTVNTLTENQDATEVEPDSSAIEIKQAKEQAYFYAKRADELGLSRGKSLVAICYGAGYGITEDRQHYLTLINQCVQRGNAMCTNLLATFYQDGVNGLLDPDPIRSLKLYFESFRKGHLDNLENFKLLIANNDKNIDFMTLAYDLCKKCLQGHLLNNALDSAVIGLFYQQDILMPANMQTAIKCFQKGADLGDEGAANALVKLSLAPENNAGLITISDAQKYFCCADDDEIAPVRIHYESHYLPLFQTLKEAWPMGLNIPDQITRLITDYADTVLEKP